ncbi:hypothetical protein [Palleronia caenipelagi]|uniref:Sugar transporter n=1 Tax=Palleronia caenipelagi TaxID=2489174 RepID=A0A547Q5Y8_9RHOB|nr:hypothetical protein [Palleronia caenipelagi]TRD21803.1 hypothetical protein FEV53_07060 [Palleronia caenipelagi]
MQSTPWHFWVIVVVAFLWQLIGAVDFTALQLEWSPWMAMITEAQRARNAQLPFFVDLCWGLSVWLGLIGVVMMALKANLAPTLLGASMVFTVVLTTYNSFLATPSTLSQAGIPGLVTLWVSALFTVFLWLYARDIRRGVL